LIWSWIINLDWQIINSVSILEVDVYISNICIIFVSNNPGSDFIALIILKNAQSLKLVKYTQQNALKNQIFGMFLKVDEMHDWIFF